MRVQHKFLTDAVIVLGLGCFYSWFLLTLKMLALCISNPALSLIGRLTMDGAIVIAFAFALLFPQRVFPINKRFLTPFLPLAVVGMLMIAYNESLGSIGYALCITGVVCIGLQYGWLTMTWVELFSMLESPRYVYQLAVATFVSSAIVALASLLPFDVSAIVAALLPALSTLALLLGYQLLGRTDPHFSTLQKRFKRTSQQFSLKALRDRSGLFRLITGAAITFSVYGFAYSFVGAGTLATIEHAQGTTLEHIVRSVGYPSAGVLLLLALLISRKQLVLSNFYWMLQPLFISGLLFASFYPLVGEIILSMSFILLMVLCTIVVCEIGHRFETPVFHLAAFVFGIGTAACFFGILAGVLAALLPSEIFGVPYLIWALIIALSIYSAITNKHGGFTFSINKNATDIPDIKSSALSEPYPYDLATCRAVYYEALAQRSTTLGERYGLTVRETEILCLLLQNLSTDCIAKELKLSPNTIKVHVHNILEKMGVRKRSELAEAAQIENRKVARL